MSELAPHYFGIRHHGPGCARSLLAALHALQPDCLLVEGPPEADAMLAFVGDAALVPPVALLAYATEAPERAVFYPFAEFSPEWQALLLAKARGIPARFIDLPQSAQLVAAEAGPAAAEGDVAEAAETFGHEEEGEDSRRREDPLGWLGRAAGFGDGESWWNQLVEERGDATDLFAAINDAMTHVRAEFPEEATPQAAQREARREAHMRKCIREAQKEGFQRIAVVCGAWHVPAAASGHERQGGQRAAQGPAQNKNHLYLGALDLSPSQPGQRLWRRRAFSGMV